MFTGLVQAVGRVVEARPGTGGTVRLVVDGCGWPHRPELGESIAVNGCCLTVAEAGAAGTIAFDVVQETLRRTTLGGLRAGSAVNLERSLAAGDLMGGHTVQGHIDGVGVVERVQTVGEWRVTIRPPGALMPYLAPKGSVAVDGVSLTVAGVTVERGGEQPEGTFEVALIPTTLERTTLRDLKPGDRCNLESDILARTVVHYLRHFGGGGAGGGGGG